MPHTCNHFCESSRLCMFQKVFLHPTVFKQYEDEGLSVKEMIDLEIELIGRDLGRTSHELTKLV